MMNRTCLFCGCELEDRHKYKVCKICFAKADRDFHKFQPKYYKAYQSYLGLKGKNRGLTYDQVLIQKGLIPMQG